MFQSIRWLRVSFLVVHAMNRALEQVERLGVQTRALVSCSIVGEEFRCMSTETHVDDGHRCCDGSGGLKPGHRRSRWAAFREAVSDKTGERRQEVLSQVLPASPEVGPSVAVHVVAHERPSCEVRRVRTGFLTLIWTCSRSNRCVPWRPSDRSSSS